MRASALFDLPSSLAAFLGHFPPDARPWQWVAAIREALASLTLELPAGLRVPDGVEVGRDVFIDPSVKLPNVATIQGPAWIGPDTEIRPGAFVRGQVIAGAGCVLGNSCEFKNCLLLDGVQAPHFSYVGDSVLGNGAHLGAGVICSNLRLDQQPVSILFPRGDTVDTGMRKLGAMLGDGAEVGCNAVLQPGAILGRRALVFPLTAFAGVLEAGTIARSGAGRVVSTPRRD